MDGWMFVHCEHWWSSSFSPVFSILEERWKHDWDKQLQDKEWWFWGGYQQGTQDWALWSPGIFPNLFQISILLPLTIPTRCDSGLVVLNPFYIQNCLQCPQSGGRELKSRGDFPKRPQHACFQKNTSKEKMETKHRKSLVRPKIYIYHKSMRALIPIIATNSIGRSWCGRMWRRSHICWFEFKNRLHRQHPKITTLFKRSIMRSR